MPYRSDASLWFNLPGVVAAYQPVACPGGALLARVNVGNEQRTPGRYAAAPGVAPSHDPRAGWTFNGTTHYLKTGISTPLKTWSALCRFSNGSTAAAYQTLFGYYNANEDTFGIDQTRADNATGFYSAAVQLTSRYTAGIIGMAGSEIYANGSDISTFGAQGTNTGTNIYVGATLYSGSAANLWSGDMQALAFYSRTLSPAEVWQASRQMAYCDVNPDWSAWGRRRLYYYEPEQAAAVRWRGIGRNDTPVSGRISTGRPI